MSGSSSRPPIIVVAGPTATGKTDVALALARRFDGELVGADSVQVYRGLDIGSAKPTADELGGTPHHLIDVRDADAPLDAMGYAELADDAIATVAARGRLPIVVGGTGLWLRALLRGLVELPKPSEEIRARLESEIATLGSGALHARLAELDPRTAGQVHPNDAVRIVRALEVHEQTGEPLGELRARHALGEPRYDAEVVHVDRGRDELRARIDQRVRTMIERDFAGEVRRLLARFGSGVRPLGSVGYREMVAHVEAGVPIDETERAIARSTRLYARRQRVWFRSEPGITPPLVLAPGPLGEADGPLSSGALERIERCAQIIRARARP